MLAEGIPGGFSSLYDSFGALETLGVCQRGYFVEGLGGAQFALPGRGGAAARAARRRRRAAHRARRHRPGAAVRRGAEVAEARGRSPARQAGAHVVLAGAEPVLYVERGGKGLQVLVDDDDPRLGPAIEALAAAVERGRIRKLGVEKVNGEPVSAPRGRSSCSSSASAPGPRKLTIGA